jgi:hypothetical protein
LVLVAAGLEVSTRSLPTGLAPEAALAIALLIAARLDMAGAVAIAAVLVRKGFDPGMAVALVALGPMLSAAVRHAATRRRAAIAIVLFVAALFGSDLLQNARVAADRAFVALHDSLPAQARGSPLGAASAAVLIVLALRTLWTAGARGWFAPLRHGPNPVTIQP